MNLDRYDEAGINAENPSKTNPFVTVSFLDNQTQNLQLPYTVVTTNATVTTIYSFTPSNGIYSIEAHFNGFEVATSNGLGGRAFATFKVIGGVVTQIGNVTTERKTDFPNVVNINIDTNGTVIRLRVTGQAGRTINWSANYRALISNLTFV
jgi:ribosomal protein L28